MSMFKPATAKKDDEEPSESKDAGKMKDQGKPLSGLLLAIAGHPKASDDSDDESEPDGSLFEEHAGDAFEAAKKGDKEGFTAALKSAIAACYDKDDDKE